MLEVLLKEDTPAHHALRRQIPHARLQGRCSCGCGTAYFDLDTSAVAPAPGMPGTVVAAGAQLTMDDGECPGEVLVFAQGGYLSWLEVCSWSDDVEVTLTLAQRLLGPPSESADERG